MKRRQAKDDDYDKKIKKKPALTCIIQAPYITSHNTFGQ